jgi:thiamine-monophosphate kinase
MNLIAINLIAVQAANTLAAGQFNHELQLKYILSGGDDYELAFTAPEHLRDAVQAASLTSSTPVTRIGQIEAALGLRLIDDQGKPVKSSFESWDHFQ